MTHRYRLFLKFSEVLLANLIGIVVTRELDAVKSSNMSRNDNIVAVCMNTSAGSCA